MKQLIIYDLDDTLFTTECFAQVIDQHGCVVEEITSKQITTYQLHDDHTYCFKHFKCSNTFVNTAISIRPIIDQFFQHQTLTKMFDQPLFDIIILTARNRFDDEHKFRDFLTTYKVDYNIPVLFAGDIGKTKSSSTDKTIALDGYLNSQSDQYQTIVMYDDNPNNLDAIRQYIHTKRPGTFFWPYQVFVDGKIVLFK